MEQPALHDGSRRRHHSNHRDGLRYCTKGHDTINGLSLEDHARSFVRCQVLAVPDLLGVEDEVWLYVEQDLNAHRLGQQTATNRSGRAGWIRAGVTAATVDGASNCPLMLLSGVAVRVLAGSAVVPTFPASRAAVDAEAVARFVTTRPAVLHATVPTNFNFSSVGIPVPAGTVLRSLPPFVKIIPADSKSDGVSARLSALQASFGGHTGTWRDPNKGQGGTDVRHWCARSVCQHGPRIVAAPHWTCCGQTILSCRCRPPIGARSGQDLQAGAPVLVCCPKCMAANDKDLSADGFHDGGRGLDGSAEEIPTFAGTVAISPACCRIRTRASGGERRCQVVWQRGSCPMDAESTGAVLMMLTDTVKPSLSRGDVDLLDRLMPAAQTERILAGTTAAGDLKPRCAGLYHPEGSKADSGGRVVVFADATGRAVCAIFPKAGWDRAATGEARRRGFLITSPCGVVRPLRLAGITVFVTSKQLLNAWWSASAITRESSFYKDDESETEVDSEGFEKNDRPPLRPLFRPLRVPATWMGLLPFAVCLACQRAVMQYSAPIS